MDKNKFIETFNKMSDDEKAITVVLYVKDIKDLLESICDAKGIEKKHY